MSRSQNKTNNNSSVVNKSPDNRYTEEIPQTNESVIHHKTNPNGNVLENSGIIDAY